MATKDELLTDALRLPVNERAEMAQELLRSLDGEPEEDVEAAWMAEIRRRLDEVRAGRAKTLSAEESLRRVDEILAQGRPSR
jgi:putative addiction module component (TIGR02574 family)